MNNLRRYLFYPFVFLFCFAVPQSYANSDIANQLADNLLVKSNHILHLFEEKSKTKELTHGDALKIIQSNISPLINYSKITRSTLGKYSRKLKADDLQKIRQSFQLLLENTYASVIKSSYGDQEINITIEDTKPLTNKKQFVSLKVSARDKFVVIAYIFTPHEDTHLITDIKIEGISLVANYRRQFSSILKKSDVETLLDKIQQLVKKKQK